MSRAPRRDRRVYLRSHPLLLALLAVTRRRPVRRLGRTVLVHGTEAYLDGLTRVPLDRLAAGTTGGAFRALDAGDSLFDQHGPTHRAARRGLADDLGSTGIERLRPVWREVLDRRLMPLRDGATVDLVDVAVELSGTTTAALLDLPLDGRRLAVAAREAASAAAREYLPGVPWPGRARHARRVARDAARRLAELLGEVGEESGRRAGVGQGQAAVLAVAAVNTTVAAIPRVVAWCADDDLWDRADDPTLTAELLRRVTPSPLSPRGVAADGAVSGHPVRAGDRLILVTRHAAGAHRPGPGTPRQAQLVFGAGSHACPGAGLARAQVTDALAALAPYRPVVVRARADRRSALPSWATLLVRAG